MNKTILLIDDNNIDNYINKAILSKTHTAKNITVKTSAIDALEYLNTLTEEFPEIIFLDIRMPIMDGFGFLNEFEKIPLTIRQNTAIYMLSSSTNEEDINKATSYESVKKYLNKPLQLESVKDLF
jgi:CheY-like chemotaxis protein